MEAPPENFAYTLLLSPDFSKPDALAVIDVKPGSPTFSQIVHTVTMPYKGDEFHRQRAGLSLVDPSLWACRGGGKPTLSTPSRTVGFCVENPSTKKAPPKRG